MKQHESGELTGEVAPEDDNEDGEDEDNELDTSRDDDDGELVIEDDAVEIEDVEENEDSDDKENAPSKIYNCVDCTRMFMSAEAHANHLREVHGGEGGSVVLKLPTDKKADKDDATEDKADDELVIDDSQ